MADWTKSADWIPYTNAIAQAIYYLKTIKSSERSLYIMDLMGVPKTDPGYKMTEEEILRKTALLEIARFKIKRSWNRITQTDRDTWKDKVPF